MVFGNGFRVLKKDSSLIRNSRIGCISNVIQDGGGIKYSRKDFLLGENSREEERNCPQEAAASCTGFRGSSVTLGVSWSQKIRKLQRIQRIQFPDFPRRRRTTVFATGG